MTTKKKSLIVAAHPDDETIFFAGLIMKYPEVNWKLICVTDGDADGQGDERLAQLKQTSELLGMSEFSALKFPDIYEQRLDVLKLEELLKKEEASVVYTHGILGEYGHPHHQDVCMAVHKAFFKRGQVHSLAYNCFPEQVVELDRSSWQIKSRLISGIYYEETKRFIEFIPATAVESYCQVSLEEVELIYNSYITGETIDPKKLNVYSWFAKYLNDSTRKSSDRPF